MSAVAGSWTGACIRQSDWTRFAKTRRAPALHQVISAPVTVTVCAILGAFATSAIKNMYGEAIWNPISVLQFLLDRDYNAATRAGCFFAGLGFFVSQVSVLMGRHWTRKGANQPRSSRTWCRILYHAAWTWQRCLLVGYACGLVLFDAMMC